MKDVSAHLKTLVMIPTYNERGSIGALIKELSENSFNILVIDDNSPDGTADFVDSMGLENVEVLRRARKDGLGNAYKAAIKFVLESSSDYENQRETPYKNRYKSIEYLVSMDGDGSHQVSDLLKMVQNISKSPKASLYLGSRWISGGAIRNWSRFRIRLSKAGTRYARWALKFPITDLTGGFRIYPRRTLEKLNFDHINSNGYSYQIEMAFAIKHLDGEIVELPITFIERESGSSKMSARVVLEAIWRVTLMGLTLRLRPTADKLHYVK